MRLISATLLLFASLALFAQQPPLIPREVLFGNPERVSPRLSPDGKRLAWLATDDKNVQQVWVKTIGGNDDRMVTSGKKAIQRYFWAEDDRTLLYLQDNDGDENYHLFGVNLDDKTVRDYTPFLGATARVVAISREMPDTLLVEMNARDRQLFDIHRLTLSTGALVLDTKNPGDVASYIADRKMHVRGASAALPDGGSEIRLVQNGVWKTWLTAGPKDIFALEGFSPDGNAAVLKSSVGRDTAAIVSRDIATGKETVLAASAEADAGAIVRHPATQAIQAVAFDPGRRRWTILDRSIEADFEALGKAAHGDFEIVNRDRADRTWLVSYIADTAHTRYYSYDRTTKKATFLFAARPKLQQYQLAEMLPVTITSRDGLQLRSYLTLPAGLPPKNLPLVLLVHGGPWQRDTWGYHGLAQWLANRGYAVLQTNFRGSTGFGKAFINAGDRQWGLAMQNDLIDAATWAVKQGYADPKRIAIQGASYGGYATLAGLAFTPDFFACGVSLVGPSNLKTLVAAFPPYWKTMRAEFDARMGNPDDPKDAELIRNASPLFRAHQIRKPLLVGQGANDPRVARAESEQIVDAIEKSGGAVTYVLYPDEGHGIARPENSLDFSARVETFFAGCLGGRAEPMAGEKHPGSTAVVRVVAPK